jgi:DNA uptake protein ComE-like DNA-binding protein
MSARPTPRTPGLSTVRTSMRMSRRAGRGGFALLVALLALALAGAAGLELHTLLRGDRLVVANVRAVARARWAARGALAGELDRLQRAVRVTGLARERLAASGDTLLPPRVLALGRARAWSAVVDVRARLDLDRATEAELAALAEAVGLGGREAAVLARRVVAWRERAGHAPIDRVEELARVPGVDPASLARLLPLLVVDADGRLGANSAPLPVLRTLPGVDAAAAAAIVARRAAAPFHNVHELLAALPEPARSRGRADVAALERRLAYAPRDVEVRVRAAAPGGAVAVELVARVRLAGGAQMALVSVVEREVPGQSQVAARDPGPASS